MTNRYTNNKEQATSKRIFLWQNNNLQANLILIFIRAKCILLIRPHSINKKTYSENAKRGTSRKCIVDLASEIVLRYQLFDLEVPENTIANHNITINQ